jgi:hypothetical protein
MKSSPARFLPLLFVLIPRIALGQPLALNPTSAVSSGAVLIKPGQRIAFLGDSTTQFGWTSPSGFIHLVTLGLAKESVPVTALQFGLQGNRPQELVDLYQTKITALTPKPD